MATSSVGFDELEKMKVSELKKQCKEHGLSATGKKEELLNRLKEALQEAEENILEESGEGDLVPESTVPDDVNDDILNEDVPKPKPALVEPVAESTKVTDKENGEPPKKIVKITTTPIEAPSSEMKVVKTLTDAERLALRAKKFGLNSEEAKKAARSQRFGSGDATSTAAATGAAKLSTAGTAVDVDKLKQRAERFGSVTSKALASVDLDDKIQKRKERFGVVSSDDKLKKRQERFGIVATSPAVAAGVKNTNLAAEEAKRKRAERFGLNK